jgi:hypothetical protein|tara:strand:+ start:5544 stop:5789 length:246 start_codon:yes stop_codon:yes gene_type:complete
MPQDITNPNDIPVMALTADISSQDVETIMGLIKLLVSQRNGTATDEQTRALSVIKEQINSPEEPRTENYNGYLNYEDIHGV